MSDGEMEDQRRKKREYMNNVICINKNTDDNSTKKCNTIINKIYYLLCEMVYQKTLLTTFQEAMLHLYA